MRRGYDPACPHTGTKDMQNVMNLQRRGYLTEQQLLHAYKFIKNPNAYNLAPTFYRVLHDALIEEEPLEAMEKRRGWPARSAKAMLGLILHAMQEMGGSHIDHEPDDSTAEERLSYLAADDAQDLMPVIREFNFTHREARLFLVLKRSPGQMCGKDALLTRMYSDRVDGAPDAKIVDVFICKMRKKLEGTQWRIDTIWGQGFRLSSVDEPAPAPYNKQEPPPNFERDVLWYKLHVYDEVPYRQIARDNDVQPSTVLRAVTKLLRDYTDKQIEDAVHKIAA